jgi:hypothetical protein
MHVSSLLDTCKVVMGGILVGFLTVSHCNLKIVDDTLKRKFILQMSQRAWCQKNRYYFSDIVLFI